MKYQDQVFDKLPLLIAEGQRPSLLGRDCLSKIKLNWHEVFGISAIEVDVPRSEYSDLFEPNSEPLRHFKAQIRLKRMGKQSSAKLGQCLMPLRNRWTLN